MTKLCGSRITDSCAYTPAVGLFVGYIPLIGGAVNRIRPGGFTRTYRMRTLGLILWLALAHAGAVEGKDRHHNSWVLSGTECSRKSRFDVVLMETERLRHALKRLAEVISTPMTSGQIKKSTVHTRSQFPNGYPSLHIQAHSVQYATPSPHFRQFLGLPILSVECPPLWVE